MTATALQLPLGALGVGPLVSSMPFQKLCFSFNPCFRYFVFTQKFRQE